MQEGAGAKGKSPALLLAPDGLEVDSKNCFDRRRCGSIAAIVGVIQMTKPNSSIRNFREALHEIDEGMAVIREATEDGLAPLRNTEDPVEDLHAAYDAMQHSKEHIKAGFSYLESLYVDFVGHSWKY